MTAGRHTVEWNGTNQSGQPAASGIYFCRLKSGGIDITRKMILLR